MSFIQEKLLHIDLGLEKRYVLIQFSDVHVVTYGDLDDKESIMKAKNQETIWLRQRLDFAHKFNEPYDSESLFSSTECLSRLIDYANHNHPDLVLLTGDIIDYYSQANYAFLTQSVKSLNSPYMFLCGNHEYPSMQFLDLCGGNCDINHIEFDEFMVVSVNNSTRKIQPSQLSDFRKLLDYKKPIILTMHVPMMTDYNCDTFMKLEAYYSMTDLDCDQVTRDFIQSVCSSDIVKAVLCGHTHGSITSLIAPNKPQYCCSSGLIGSVNKIIIQ
ncbi:MAG: metallophosphoesterase [Candidatus Izemoplasmatales bacterium]|nr:metallophosphoesterase [Candidatus Izemoplasmatales bacterium]